MAVETPFPFLWDGIEFEDGGGTQLRLLQGQKVQLPIPWYEQQTLAGNIRTGDRLGHFSGLHRPTGTQLWRWVSSEPVVDGPLLRLAQRYIGRPGMNHTFAAKVPRVRFIDGGSNPNEPSGMTEFCLDCHVLGNAYGPSGGIGVNAGVAPDYVQDLHIFDMDTGLEIDVVFGRSFEVVDNSAIVAGDTLTLTTYDRQGVLVDTVVLTEGVEWNAGVDEAATATDIAGAIVAAGIDIDATASGAFASFWRDGAGGLQLSIVNALSSRPAAIVAHPTTDEIALDVEGEWAFNGFKCGAAPDNSGGVLAIQGYFLLYAKAALVQLDMDRQRVLSQSIGYDLVVQELGLGDLTEYA